jgi:hypothetical protein
MILLFWIVYTVLLGIENQLYSICLPWSQNNCMKTLLIENLVCRTKDQLGGVKPS